MGRLLAHNSRAAGRYVIDLIPGSILPGGVRLHWTIRPEWDDWARWSEGCYVLWKTLEQWQRHAGKASFPS